MNRKIFNSLKEWKNKVDRNPLIIRGARQVGKTWLMKELGRLCYKQTLYVNFDTDTIAKSLFNQDLDVNRIIRGLEIAYSVKIIPEQTLIILDEIQEVPQALSTLKYFYEQLPQYHIVTAGSLLGVSLHEANSFPGWEYQQTSFLRDYLKIQYQKMFHNELEIDVTHAGLECGILVSKRKNLDCVSIGPNIMNAHTWEERVEIESVNRVYAFVLQLLKDMI